MQTTPNDDGFSLIDGIVGMMLFGIVMTAAVPATFGSLRTQENMQARQHAVRAAEGALQTLNSTAVSPTADGCIPLLAGRTELNAGTFDDAMGVDELTHVVPAYSTADCHTLLQAELGADTFGALEATITQSSNVDGVVVATRTFVGRCTMPQTGLSCVDPTTVSDPAEHYRIIAVSSWPDETCPGGTCEYVVSTLRNAQPDMVFTNLEGTVSWAVNDSVCVVKNTSSVVNVIANDGNPNAATTATVDPAPSRGSLTGDALAGGLTYTPQTDYVGPDTFAYRLTSLTGNVSSPALVTISVSESC